MASESCHRKAVLKTSEAERCPVSAMGLLNISYCLLNLYQIHCHWNTAAHLAQGALDRSGCSRRASKFASSRIDALANQNLSNRPLLNGFIRYESPLLTFALPVLRLDAGTSSRLMYRWRSIRGLVTSQITRRIRAQDQSKMPAGGLAHFV